MTAPYAITGNAAGCNPAMSPGPTPSCRPGAFDIFIWIQAMIDAARHDEMHKLDDMVAASDIGNRRPEGFTGRLMLSVAACWSLFQLWIASPLPYMVGVGVFNSTETRSIHLALAVFLGFMAFPAFRRSPRDRVPLLDWVLGLGAAFCAAYIYLFYNELATRPGSPTTLDVVVALTGL